MENDNQSNKLVEPKKRKRDDMSELEILECELQEKKYKCDIRYLICPITKQIFYYPVITNDGFTYEKWAVDNLIKFNSQSPLTREPIRTYTENKIMFSAVNDFLDKNNKFKRLRFEDSYYTDYIENKKECHKLLERKDFQKFCEYKDILLTDDFKKVSVIHYIILNCNEINYFQKILDNCVDLNVPDSRNLVPMYYICKYGNEQMISYGLFKKMEIKSLNSDDDTALHLIIENEKINKEEKISIIKYFIDNNLIDLEFKNRRGLTSLTKILYFDGEISNLLIKNLVDGQINNSQKLILGILDVDNLARIVLQTKFEPLDYLIDTLRGYIIKIDKNIIADHIINNFKMEQNNFELQKVIGVTNLIFNDLMDNDHLNKDQKVIIDYKLRKLLFEDTEFENVISNKK